jgi:lysozyme
MSRWAWCLVKDDNRLATGWQLVGDYYYYFYSNGQMACDEWLEQGDNWFRFDSSGKMMIGWYQEDENWFYFSDNGVMYKSTTITIDGKEYTFDKKGIMQSDNLVSDDLVTFVKIMEGFISTKYDDGCGVITQGYGCTGNEISDWGETVSEEVASTKLVELLNNTYAPPIKTALKDKNVELTQNQFDSLVSLAYNIGTSSVLNSTVFKDICNGVRGDKITTDFQMWSKGTVNGKLITLQGLYKRRTFEANIFNNADYSVN